MKKMLILVLLASLSCNKGDDGNNNGGNNGGNNTDCGSFNGYTLYKDGQGCYYNGANYSKVYVEDNKCTCD